jgi:DNA-directed RNA polymerase specialized sigma24 family protein
MGQDGEIFEDFGAFYRRHLDRVLAFCVQRTGEPELAADVAAEVFAAALTARRRYRPQQGAPESWLLGIAAHKLSDAQRRGHVERRAQRRLGIPPIEWTDEDLARVSRGLATLRARISKEEAR